MLLIFYTREHCHLCDRLLEMLEPHLQRMRAAGLTVSLESRDVDADEQALEKFDHRVPVLLAGDTVLLEGRPSAEQVQHALAGLSLRLRRC